jgi:hypothetical protein
MLLALLRIVVKQKMRSVGDKNVPRARRPIAGPGAAEREALSAFTRVFDALWHNAALQTPIAGLPEIGA